LKFVIAVIALIVLCMPAFGQTTPEEWFDKGIALMNQSKYDGATQAFGNAIELNPQYVEAWAGKGWSLYGSGRYYEALQAYDQAIELNPYYADAWAGTGFALLALRYLPPPIDVVDRANAAFDRAIALDPNYGLAWLGAFILGRSNLIGPDKAIALNPRYATTLVDSMDYTKTLSFQRMVFLKEGSPRTLKAAALVPPPVPQKSLADRFTELNKNATK